MESDHLEILYDHYKRSVDHKRSMVNARLRLIPVLLVCIILMAWLGIDPENTSSLIRTITAVKADTGFVEVSLKGLGLEPAFVNSLVWVLFVALSIQLYQRSSVIDFQAEYVKELEVELDEALQREVIRSERRSRPAFVRKANHFYKLLFGIFALLLAAAKIVIEALVVIGLYASSAPRSVPYFLVDLVLFCALFYYSVIFFRQEKSP